MILVDTDLSLYADSANACWVQDVERARVTWANPAAVKMLRAASLEELYERDVTALSQAEIGRASCRERV